MQNPTQNQAIGAPPRLNVPGNSAEVPAWFEWLSDAGLDGAVCAFAAILMGAATSRSALSTLLGVRSTTVSAWVAAMIRSRLVTELPTTPGRRGRPLGQLVANPHRLAVSVLMVHSQSVHIATVNLLGQALWNDSAALASDCENAAMQGALNALQQRAIEHLPVGTTLIGVSYSLSGLINVHDATWVFSSRWPKINNLNLRGISPPHQQAIRVARNMDAQLKARCLRGGSSGQTERTLLLHWGYGIGATFSAGNGTRIDDATGFGEVGHWKLPQQNLRCRCGHIGCLETVAALWAIGPKLLGPLFDDSMNEAQTADLLRSMDLTAHPVFEVALNEMVLSVGNLCRVFFPTKLVISGPFIENPGAWAAFTAAFSRQGLLVNLPMPRLEAQHTGHQLEQEGASMPLLLNGISELLAEASA